MDAIPSLEVWRRLAAEPELVEAASAADPADVRAVERLRAGHDAGLVAAALTLADARRRLRPKFPGLADRLWADRAAAEQASSGRLAAWKSERFRRALAEVGTAGAFDIEDRCCGMGGDAMSLARVGRAVAIDRNEVRAWMAGRNAGCETLVADAATEPLRAGLVHFDPARRDEGRGERTVRLDRHEPPVDRCIAVVRAARGGAIKLSPGVPPDLVAGLDAEIEFISDESRLVQAVAWFGCLAERPGRRTATRLPDGASRSGTGTEALPVDSRCGGYLLVPDPALERSGLLGELARELGLWERAPGLGILEGDRPVGTGWLLAYESLARARARERDVTEVLRSLGAGRACVHTRGKSADADAWTRALSGGAGPELDVFLLRVGARREAIVARRVRP